MPKGVLWRQHDIFMTSFGGRSLVHRRGRWVLRGDRQARADDPGTQAHDPSATDPRCRAMGGHDGNDHRTDSRILLGRDRSTPTRCPAIEREKVMAVTVVGDAMARPLAPRSKSGDGQHVVAGGGGERRCVADPDGQTAPDRRQARADRRRRRRLLGDRRADDPYVGAGRGVDRDVQCRPGTFVAAEDLGADPRPGHDGIGWLAQRGYVPLGYKGDAAKTAATFPVIDGVRYSVPGDRARHLEDGAIQLLGRDSVTINSGGEKIFVEEVETAIASHPAVADVVVSGRTERAVGPGGRRGRRARRRRQRRCPGTDRPRRRLDRPIQAAQGDRIPAGDRAQPGRKGRLPMGPRAGHQRRRLTTNCRPVATIASTRWRPEFGTRPRTVIVVHRGARHDFGLGH